MTSDRLRNRKAAQVPAAGVPAASGPAAGVPAARVPAASAAERSPTRNPDAARTVRDAAMDVPSAPIETASAPTAPVPAIDLPPGPAQGAMPGFEFSPHNCFACGTLNAHGLGLVLHVQHSRSWTELTLGRSFEGWEGFAHGGIICTILDEVMAWALVGADNWGVTARMSVDFRRPVPVGRQIRAEGVIASMRRRVVDTTAQLVDAETGEVLATATGTYVAAGDERKRELRERYGYRVLADTTGEATSPDSAEPPAPQAPTATQAPATQAPARTRDAAAPRATADTRKGARA